MATFFFLVLLSLNVSVFVMGSEDFSNSCTHSVKPENINGIEHQAGGHQDKLHVSKTAEWLCAVDAVHLIPVEGHASHSHHEEHQCHQNSV